MLEKSIDDLVREGIENAGADGLVNVELECGCGTDDLMLCGDPSVDGCVLAQRVPVPEDQPDATEWFVPLERRDDDLT